jgi:protein gp37
MGTQTTIEWTESTWNPLTGCTKVSPGCKHCYAERMSSRLRAMGQANYANGFRLTLHDRVLELPLTWRKPQVIFVNSMSDLFHADVPEPFIARVFDTMVRAHWHRYQVLTKRAERLAELAPRLPWPEHIWMGVSVENADYLSRLDSLRAANAAVKFVSIEPLLGPLDCFDPRGLDWVIVGGESGPGARPMQLDWVRPLRDRCQASGVPFFLKQLGGYPDKRGGEKAVLDGRRWIQMPSTSVARQGVLAGTE